MRTLRHAWLTLVRWIGKTLNVSGAPGFVRDCEYRSNKFDAVVRVRRTALYTIISVNEVDIYFYRLTGGIDGIGISQVADCKPVSVEE